MTSLPPPASRSNRARTRAGDSTGWLAPRLIGVGVDGTPSGRDAVALGSLLASTAEVELILIAVREEPLLVVALPRQQNWAASEKQARAMLITTRDEMAPDARVVVASDTLVWRALRRVVQREHRDLLVVGSAQTAEDGRVRLGTSAEDLVARLECPLAVAPNGMARREKTRLERIGVGVDGRPESLAALDLAASLAWAAGAELLIRGVVDDPVRLPRPDEFTAEDEPTLGSQPVSPFDRRLVAEHTGGVPADTRVEVGMPTDVLSELADEVDLLVIGSGRSRQPRRVQLGSTGRALLRDAPCPVLIVPRQRG